MATARNARNSVAAASSAAASPLLPVLGEGGLFDSFESVANDSLARIREDIGDCKRCKLSKDAQQKLSSASAIRRQS